MRGRSTRPALVIRSALAASAIVGSAAAAAVSPARSGLYLSDSVELVLRDDGTFAVQELGGARQARGHYRVDGDGLIFVSGEGDVGRTRFPLACRTATVFDGFVFGPDQPRCRAFEGLQFRSAQ